MKVTLVDIKYAYREVEVPLICRNEKCGADLTVERSVVSWFYEDQRVMGAFVPPKEISPNIEGTEEERESFQKMEKVLLNEEEEETGFVAELDGDRKGGESFLGTLTVVCASCGTVIVSGLEQDVTGEQKTG